MTVVRPPATKRGPVTFGLVTLHLPSGPLMGGSILAGATVEFDRVTGRVLRIGDEIVDWSPKVVPRFRTLRPLRKRK